MLSQGNRTMPHVLTHPYSTWHFEMIPLGAEQCLFASL